MNIVRPICPILDSTAKKVYYTSVCVDYAGSEPRPQTLIQRLLEASLLICPNATMSATILSFTRKSEPTPR